MGVNGCCFDCVLSHCTAAGSALGGEGAGAGRGGQGSSGQSFSEVGIRPQRCCNSGREWGMLLLQCVRADEEAMLGGECGREIWHQDKAVTRGRRRGPPLFK